MSPHTSITITQRPSASASSAMKAFRARRYFASYAAFQRRGGFGSHRISMPAPADQKSTVWGPIRARRWRWAMVPGAVKFSPSIGTAVQATAGGRQGLRELASWPSKTVGP